ncbi:MAG TPA: hypothetical protein DEP87_04310, partial [Candidatus Pacebacteria bacterium]|nr:hypothetical protein [Candidatus Paceibacterota bacterium]
MQKKSLLPAQNIPLGIPNTHSQRICVYNQAFLQEKLDFLVTQFLINAKENVGKSIIIDKNNSQVEIKSCTFLTSLVSYLLSNLTISHE